MGTQSLEAIARSPSERPSKRRQALTELAVTNEPTFTEVTAIERARQGDPLAFEFLYSMHKRRVFMLCLRMAKDIAVAEELTQDSFLQVYRKLATFRGDAAFSTWLHRLVVNVVLMHLRRKSLPQVPVEDMRSSEYDFPPQYGGKDAVLGGVAERVVLERTIAELPPGYRLMFVLHDVEGYEHKEIAEMLGCTIGNSKSQLHKARLRIRHLLMKSTVRALRSTPVSTE